MNHHFRLLAAVILLTIASNSIAQQAIVTDLRVEHLSTPLGIDTKYPRFSWRLQDTRDSAYQIGYAVCVSTDSAQVSKGIGPMWNILRSGSADQLVTYEGEPLQPFTKYYWSVRAIDRNRNETPYAISTFETGMMEDKNWKGTWISDNRDMNLQPAPVFRTTFSVDKKMTAARAYIAVAGLYELYVNGRRVGDELLNPAYTRFDRRNLYITHDITPYLREGENELRVLLGNGWYNHQSRAVWNFDNAYWRQRPSFCMDVRITYADGSVHIIPTGLNWRTALSEVVFNSIYTGEHVDARKKQVADTAWKEIFLCSAPSQNITAQMMHPVRITDTLTPQHIRKLADDNYVVDFGRNIAGITELRIAGASGTVIKIKHGERIYKDGHVDLSNINVHYRGDTTTDPFATDVYTLSGNGIDTFRPKFNYKGFRYAEIISSQPLNITTENITAYFIHSDVPVAGKIKSANPLIDKIWEATNHSYLSNLMGYPTDCPQREKNGWTGDAHIASETGLYNFDAATVYEKWMGDHRDEQQPNGTLPSIIPTSIWGYEWGNGPDWTSTIAIIPWNVYLFTGDPKILADNYEAMKRYVDHINDLYPSGLCAWGLGDWVPVKTKTPVELTSTCYYYKDVAIIAAIAKLLAHPDVYAKRAQFAASEAELEAYADDYAKYAALAEKIRTAFNNKYFDSTKYIYDKGNQTAMAVPLHFGLVPEKYRQQVADNLAARVKADSTQIDVGLLGSKSILNALSENGYADLAYQLASREKYPSWGHWIKNGATTLWENWSMEAQNDLSENHIMFGEIGAWFYKGLGGIKPDPAAPGFKNILLEPHFVKGLDSFWCYHDSPYGRITSSWKRSKKKIEYTVTLPPGCTAMLKVAGNEQRIEAGTYHFSF